MRIQRVVGLRECRRRIPACVCAPDRDDCRESKLPIDGCAALRKALLARGKPACAPPGVRRGAIGLHYELSSRNMAAA